MAGSAAGAAKARLARAARKQQRAAFDQQAETLMPSVVAPSVAPVATVATDGGTLAASGQDVAESLIGAALPEAVTVLVEGMRRPNSAAMRHASACKLLDLGLKADRKGGGIGGGLAGRLREVQALRARRAAAVDAVPAGGDSVVVTSSQPSAQQPDTLSESSPASAPNPS